MLALCKAMGGMVLFLNKGFIIVYSEGYCQILRKGGYPANSLTLLGYIPNLEAALFFINY